MTIALQGRKLIVPPALQFVADRLLVQLGCNKIYKVSCPFDFMELISLEQKTNFFESRNASYSLDSNKKNDDVFSFNAEF